MVYKYIKKNSLNRFEGAEIKSTLPVTDLLSVSVGVTDLLKFCIFQQICNTNMTPTLV